MDERVPASPQLIIVRSEGDVIALRQEVRQAARALSLPLPQQAKLTTAVSAVARAALVYAHDTAFSIVVRASLLRPALDIACTTTGEHTAEVAASLERALAEGGVGGLVDSLNVAVAQQGVVLTLRMWLKAG